MSVNKINKIVRDLQSDNEKTIILALMYITRLQIDACYEKENFHKLHILLNQFHSSSNPDISYLSGKAKNFLSENLSLRTSSTGVTTEKNSSKEINVAKQSKADSISDLKTYNSAKFDTNLINLQNYTRYLNHEDDRFRSQAVEICAKSFPHNQLHSILMPLLRDKNNRVRANVIVALKEMNPVLLHKSLEEMLSSPRISMRESAIWAISKLNSNELYLKLLMKALHDPYRDIRLRSIGVLRAYHCKDVITQMRRLSTDSDLDVSKKATETLQYFQKYKSKFTVTNSAVGNKQSSSNSRDNLSLLINDNEDSIVIEDKFIDLFETGTNTSNLGIQSKEHYVTQFSVNRTDKEEISRKIKLHQKLQSLNVEDFFNSNKFSNQSSDDIHTESDWKDLSLPTPVILSWIPEEYRPIKYKQVSSNDIKHPVSENCDAQKIRRKISKLLIKVGTLRLNQQYKASTGNKKADTVVQNILNITQKIGKIKFDDILEGHQKKLMLDRLEQTYKEALIQLGRLSIKEYNHNQYKCLDLNHYQKRLKQLIDRLAQLKP